MLKQEKGKTENTQALFEESQDPNTEENAPASSPWTDGMHTDDELPMDTEDKDNEPSGETIDVPIVLKNLELNGVRFMPVSKNAFILGGLKCSIIKSLTLFHHWYGC